MAASLGPESFVPYYDAVQNSDEERLRKILDDISQLFRLKEFDEELQTSLKKDYPDYMDILEKRARDLLRKDCAIVFTGETSAGKSLMINLVLKSDILPDGMGPTTKIICKIMHSDRKVIKVFNRDGVEVGDEEEFDTDSEENSSDFLNCFRDQDDINPNGGLREENTETLSKDGASIPQEESEENSNDCVSILKRLFKSAAEARDIHSVEIHHPTRILKGKITIVDTPGVGDNERLNKILEEYLPNAVAFVFVVNPTSGGGMQEDRILKVMGSIKTEANSMICFEPTDVIFVVNKWDGVYNRRSKNTEKEWNEVVHKIKKSWPNVNPDNIFKMSAKLVDEGDQFYSNSFSCFEKCLHSLVDKNINKRIENNRRFLKKILFEVDMFVNSRISATSRSLPELKQTSDECLRRLKQLERKSETMLPAYNDILKRAIESHKNRLMLFIESEEFKNQVLSQDSRLGETSRPRISALISTRMQKTISSWIDTKDSEFSSDLNKCIKIKLHEIQEELEEILRELDCTSENLEADALLEELFSRILKSKWFGFGLGILSFSILAPLFSIEVCATAAAVTTVLSYNFAMEVFEGIKTMKMSRNEVIEMYFVSKRDAITEKAVKEILEKKYGARYREIFKELFHTIVPKEIRNQERKLTNLNDDYKKCVLKKTALNKLSHEIKRIKISLESLHL